MNDAEMCIVDTIRILLDRLADEELKDTSEMGQFYSLGYRHAMLDALCVWQHQIKIFGIQHSIGSISNELDRVVHDSGR